VSIHVSVVVLQIHLGTREWRGSELERRLVRVRIDKL